MEHTKHLWRAVLILVFVGIVGIMVRHFLIPQSFGLTGFYRHDSLAEFMAAPVVYGGPVSCTKCHKEVAKEKAEGGHASVSCEVCHGPVSGHAKDGEKIADMPVNRSYTLCAYCHQKLRARPESMPQVDFREHLVGEELIGPDEPIPENVCSVCHEVHNP